MAQCPKNPHHVDQRSQSSAEDRHHPLPRFPPRVQCSGRRLLPRFSDTTLAGPLPAKPRDSGAYLLPQAGDTFSQLVARLALEEALTSTAARAARGRLAPAILKLNPGLTPDHILANVPLRLPDDDEFARLCPP